VLLADSRVKLGKYNCRVGMENICMDIWRYRWVVKVKCERFLIAVVGGGVLLRFWVLVDI
jgi:hypothetical protein